MRHMVSALLCVGALVPLATAQEATVVGAEVESLPLLERLPIDPLVAGAMRLQPPETLFDRFLAFAERFISEEEQAQLEESTAQLDAALGVSLRDDILAQLDRDVSALVHANLPNRFVQVPEGIEAP